MPATAASLHERLAHPVIDADGHGIEFLPLVREELRALAGDGAVAQLDVMIQSASIARRLPDDEKRRQGLMRIPWWGLPTENTLDRATAMLPALMHERLPEIGIDFAVVYPTYGLMALSMGGDEARQASCRAFNRYHADVMAGLGDRMTPAALIPMHAPEEALAELDHAVGHLGLKVVLLAGHVQRPLPGVEGPRGASWLDTFGPESPFDYDPVWARCQELGVSPTFHSSGMGWGSRASLHNYVSNHIGNFAAAAEAICRSLVMSGVPQRFPGLRFAFLEGGVAWACQLYADLLGHFEKRGGDAIRRYDPARLDRALLERLFEAHATPRVAARHAALGESLALLSEPDEDPDSLDEFAHSGITSADDARVIFGERFFFGCEADDPMNAAAYDRRRNPGGATLNAVFGSDIGHWDVPDMASVLGEAFELVDAGLLEEADFRRFVFASPAALFTGTNPEFFEGTAVEEAVAKELACA
jgi:predicted TIM-barrel fold metal-dependent hydrolase